MISAAMGMLIAVGQLLGGLVVLYFGAEWLVKGAAGLARSLGVRPLLVGLTVVAYGTSTPELVVSTLAALDGRSAIALGNVVGSNIANLGLIFGLTALIAPVPVEGGLVRLELPMLVLTAVAVPLLLLDGSIGRLEAAILLVGAVVFTVMTSRRAPVPPPSEVAAVEADAEAAGAPAVEGRAALIGLAVVGLAMLVGGGKLFVDGATRLALALGMSERTVGLTIVAVGTSLPELAASLIAAVRGHGAIAVGNIVGSNIFNVLFVLGGAGVIQPIGGSVGGMVRDLVALAVMTAAGAFVLRSARTVTRLEGVLLVLAYAAFLAVVALSA